MKLVWLSGAILLTMLLYFSGVGCVWRYLIHIPCPGCGMTRAVLAVLCGDFKGMLRYHFMAPFLPVVLVYILYDGHIFRYRWIDNSVLAFIALGFLGHWITAFF